MLTSRLWEAAPIPLRHDIEVERVEDVSECHRTAGDASGLNPSLFQTWSASPTALVKARANQDL